MVCLRALAALEVVSEKLLEKYREPPDPSVVDLLYFAADHGLCSVAQGYHQFAQGRLVLPLAAVSFRIIDGKR